ncbi:MAG: ATP-binding protein [Thermoproteota archaeon]|nr:ATP-binding protein [Thermoproteota archaeon]
MTVELKVHPSFFREFATKTWVSPYEIVKELVENAFDEDATTVLITLLGNGSVLIEDNAGMDAEGMEKFLLLGSPHKRYDSISPRLRRIRTGRYGTGRLSFLTSFDSMKIRTRRDSFHKTILLDASVLDNLSAGYTSLAEISDPALNRNGSELSLVGPKQPVDLSKLTKEIRKLAILRLPLFRVFVKTSDIFKEWDFTGAEEIRAPDIQGHKIPVNLDNGKIVGEVVIARRPLSEDENGIAIMVGNHVVTRGTFGFDNRLKRVTGFVRCDSLTSRFADKSAIIEDEEYAKFYKSMQSFVGNTVIPSLSEYEDVLITREESRIYKEIDKVLGQAIVENIETEEVEGYETVEIQQQHSTRKIDQSDDSLPKFHERALPGGPLSSGRSMTNADQESPSFPENPQKEQPVASEAGATRFDNSGGRDLTLTYTGSQGAARFGQVPAESTAGELPLSTATIRRIKRPILKKTFALKRIGYKVIPYEDESDSRYSFTNENVVFVNKANSTYTAEARRGDEFLLRHIIGIVAEAIASSKHPEGKNALELQNRLVAEAIRIHDNTSNKNKA